MPDGAHRPVQGPPAFGGDRILAWTVGVPLVVRHEAADGGGDGTGGDIVFRHLVRSNQGSDRFTEDLDRSLEIDASTLPRKANIRYVARSTGQQ